MKLSIAQPVSTNIQRMTLKSLSKGTNYPQDIDLDFTENDRMFGPEEAEVQWDFYCDKFARSFADIKALLQKAHPGKDKDVIKGLNAGKDPIKVFSEFASRHLNVFQAVSSDRKAEFLKSVSAASKKTKK